MKKKLVVLLLTMVTAFGVAGVAQAAEYQPDELPYTDVAKAIGITIM